MMATLHLDTSEVPVQGAVLGLTASSCRTDDAGFEDLNGLSARRTRSGTSSPPRQPAASGAQAGLPPPPPCLSTPPPPRSPLTSPPQTNSARRRQDQGHELVSPTSGCAPNYSVSNQALGVVSLTDRQLREPDVEKEGFVLPAFVKRRQSRPSSQNQQPENQR